MHMRHMQHTIHAPQAAQAAPAAYAALHAHCLARQAAALQRTSELRVCLLLLVMLLLDATELLGHLLLVHLLCMARLL
eukprot:1158334-Pelagomonas_calceolata.AAC.4